MFASVSLRVIPTQTTLQRYAGSFNVSIECILFCPPRNHSPSSLETEKHPGETPSFLTSVSIGHNGEASFSQGQLSVALWGVCLKHLMQSGRLSLCPPSHPLSCYLKCFCNTRSSNSHLGACLYCSSFMLEGEPLTRNYYLTLLFIMKYLSQLCNL